MTELTAGPFTLFAQVLYGFHDNPRRNAGSRRLLGVARRDRRLPGAALGGDLRYDQIVSRHETALDARYATVHVTYLVRPNVKVSFESTAPLDALELTVLSLRLDLAI